MPRKELVKGVKRIVVKIGTSTLTEEGHISTRKLSQFIDDVIAVRGRGYQVVIVTSGAIAAGASTLGRDRSTLTIPEKQAFSAIGQAVLMNEYRDLFQKRGIHVGQILLTEDDVKHRRRFLNARHTLETLLELGAVPIINENDSVVVKEIKFGDNDTLSAHITSLINADLLVLLSDIDGFYMDLGDPAPVEEVRAITDDIIMRAGGAGSAYGTGGMITKIRAAEMIIRFGEKMIIAKGDEPGVLSRIMNGEKIGTIFLGRGKSLPSRKKWLALRKSRGTVLIDRGAVEALVQKKRSLLATGVTAIEGPFDMGDIVELCDDSRRAVGKGIVNYNFAELELIKGKRTAEIRTILGSKYFEEVINRDDLVIY